MAALDPQQGNRAQGTESATLRGAQGVSADAQASAGELTVTSSDGPIKIQKSAMDAAWGRLDAIQQNKAWTKANPEQSQRIFALAEAAVRHELRMDWAYYFLRILSLGTTGVVGGGIGYVAWHLADTGQGISAVGVLSGAGSAVVAVLGTRFFRRGTGDQ
jgi:hypothetical protein